MEEEVVFLKNDTYRLIEGIIEHIKKWQTEGGRVNPRETALVITKLEEALFWSMKMVDRK